MFELVFSINSNTDGKQYLLPDYKLMKIVSELHENEQNLDGELWNSCQCAENSCQSEEEHKPGIKEGYYQQEKV
jgi:hypothetical protein